MSDDFEIEKGVMLGDWLHDQFKQEVHFEEEPSWMGRVGRIEARLQEVRGEGERLKIEVPWIEEVKLSEDASWKTKARIWAWQRARGYLPIRDRRKVLLDYLDDRSAPSKGD